MSYPASSIRGLIAAKGSRKPSLKYVGVSARTVRHDRGISYLVEKIGGQCKP
jgi:hypothetical protein